MLVAKATKRFLKLPPDSSGNGSHRCCVDSFSVHRPRVRLRLSLSTPPPLSPSMFVNSQSAIDLELSKKVVEQNHHHAMGFNVNTRDNDESDPVQYGDHFPFVLWFISLQIVEEMVRVINRLWIIGRKKLTTTWSLWKVRAKTHSQSFFVYRNGL